MGLFINLKNNNLYKYNKVTNSNKEIIKIKEFTKKAKRAIRKA